MQSMPLDADVEFTCPVCWEIGAIGVDPSGGKRQQLTEDCAVCCRPLVFEVVFERDGLPMVESVEPE